MFFWLAAETGLRAGELTALRVGDVDFTDPYIEVSKAIWHGTEDGPKTTAAFRSVCISSRLGACLAEYLAGHAEGYLFQTGAGSPWDSSNVLERKLNTTLDRLGIPKIDEKLLAKIVGKDRTIDRGKPEREACGIFGAAFFSPHECHGDGFPGYPAPGSQAAARAQQWNGD